MRNISKMIKCRAIFLQSLATLYNGDFVFNEDFDLLLDSFFDSYIHSNFDKFNLIYNFRLEDGKLVIHEEDEWREILIKYINCFRINDTKNIIKLYNDVGFSDTQKLSELAEMFYEYLALISDDKVMIKS